MLNVSVRPLICVFLPVLTSEINKRHQLCDMECFLMFKISLENIIEFPFSAFLPCLI